MKRKRYEPNPNWLADGLRLLQAIKISGLSQKQFALSMGVGTDVVSRWTSGRMSFRDHFIRKAAVAVLGCTMAQLDGDEPFSYSQRRKAVDYSISRSGIKLAAPAAETLYAKLTAELAAIGFKVWSFKRNATVNRDSETPEASPT
jgi:transcriptional regulator with XRE-family HTH domain